VSAELEGAGASVAMVEARLRALGMVLSPILDGTAAADLGGQLVVGPEHSGMQRAG
jgi:monoamine oxidase